MPLPSSHLPQGIDDIHFDLFVNRVIPNRVAPTVILSWGQYNNPKLLWNQLSRVVAGAQETVSVKNLDGLPAEIRPT